MLFALLRLSFQTPANPLWLCHPCSQATLAIEHNTKHIQWAMLHLCHPQYWKPPTSNQGIPRVMNIGWETSWTLLWLQKQSSMQANKQTNKVNKHVISSWSDSNNILPSGFITIWTSAVGAYITNISAKMCPSSRFYQNHTRCVWEILTLNDSILIQPINVSLLGYQHVSGMFNFKLDL